MSSSQASPVMDPKPEGTRGRKILVVSSSALPNRGGSAIIVENLAQQFSPDEMVVLAELSPMQKAKTDRPKSMPSFHYFRSRLSLLGRGDRFFAAIRWRLLPWLVRRIVSIARAEQCDVILGVYPDEFYCYASYLAAERLGIPFSTYFHNTYLDNAALNQRRATRIQPLLFARSDFVFVMSDGMKRFFDEKYRLPNVVPLRHTFSKYPAAAEMPARRIAQGETVRLVLFGTFNESNLDATRRLVSSLQNHPRYELHVYTDIPKMLLSARGVDTSRLVHHGFIDDRRLLAELRQYDIAVLTHGFTGAYGEVEYRTIFPTRTIPMLLCGLPILVHSPAGAFVTEFIREHGCGLVVDSREPAAIVAGLDRLTSDSNLVKRLVDSAARTAELFYGPNVAGELRDRLLVPTQHRRAPA